MSEERNPSPITRTLLGFLHGVAKAVDWHESATLARVVHVLRTKYAQNHHAQEWAEWIESGEWKKDESSLMAPPGTE